MKMDGFHLAKCINVLKNGMQNIQFIAIKLDFPSNFISTFITIFLAFLTKLSNYKLLRSTFYSVVIEILQKPLKMSILSML